jgi:hypothetical protein
MRLLLALFISLLFTGCFVREPQFVREFCHVIEVREIDKWSSEKHYMVTWQDASGETFQEYTTNPLKVGQTAFIFRRYK